MNRTHSILLIAVIAIVTAALRFLPFIIFNGKRIRILKYNRLYFQAFGTKYGGRKTENDRGTGTWLLSCPVCADGERFKR